MRTATKPYILSPLQGLLLQEAQDVIPDCQKHFSAAYQDLKTIVEEDVSAESFCCHCDATFHSTYNYVRWNYLVDDLFFNDSLWSYAFNFFCNEVLSYFFLQIVKGISKGNNDQVIEFSRQDRTRGSGYKLEKLRFRTDR